MWKKDLPLDIADCAIHGSNNCSQNFAITSGESFALLWRNFLFSDSSLRNILKSFMWKGF